MYIVKMLNVYGTWKQLLNVTMNVKQAARTCLCAQGQCIIVGGNF